MERIVSCCGVVCSACKSFPGDCPGCPELKGRVYWLQYTGEEVCDIYQCCVVEKGLPHCGQCPDVPCHRYELEDPTKSREENEADFQSQMEVLKTLD